jgi:hypothetical protein
MNEPDKEDVLRAMSRYGGSFIQALAEAFRRADLTNTQILLKAFPHYWEQYSEMARMEIERSKEDREP